MHRRGELEGLPPPVHRGLLQDLLDVKELLNTLDFGRGWSAERMLRGLLIVLRKAGHKPVRACPAGRTHQEVVVHDAPRHDPGSLASLTALLH